MMRWEVVAGLLCLLMGSAVAQETAKVTLQLQERKTLGVMVDGRYPVGYAVCKVYYPSNIDLTVALENDEACKLVVTHQGTDWLEFVTHCTPHIWIDEEHYLWKLRVLGLGAGTGELQTMCVLNGENIIEEHIPIEVPGIGHLEYNEENDPT